MSVRLFLINCVECNDPDDLDMVQCDECNQWAHYRCVGVGPEIENFDWSCRFCRVTSMGLSLTQASATKVDASVGAEISEIQVPQMSVDASVGNENNKVLKRVKADTDLNPIHLSLEDKATFDFYQNELAKFRGPDMNATIREIAKNLFSDEVLKDYSYHGQRKKFRFKDYDNLSKVVVLSTIESMKRVYREIYNKEKVETDEEKKKLYDEVMVYFTKEYIKKATSRYMQSIKLVEK